VVIDNTSPSVAVRNMYIIIAKASSMCSPHMQSACARDICLTHTHLHTLDIACRCFWFQTSPQLAAHLNLYREKESQGKRKRLPASAFEAYANAFAEPQMAEGFSEIVLIDFVAKFTTPSHRQLFLQYT
jgi:hypothetical protein